MNTETILSTFETFRMEPTKIDKFNEGGRDNLIARLASFVNSSRTIEFVMLGYPFKSTNHRDKTLGVKPDLAEEVSLTNFKVFGDEMRKVYPPGVKVTVVSDGYVFSDVLSESDRVVEEYGEAVRSMIHDAPVEIINLRDFYPGVPLEAARRKVVEHHPVSEEELQRRILFDPNVHSLYLGMAHFMEEEIANRMFPSHNQLRKAAKLLTRQMMIRNEAYGDMASREFPNAIRLSMHPTTNEHKFSFQLIPGKRSRHSPWHAALLVESDGTYTTVHRKDAIAAGHELVERDGRPFYFQAK